MKYDAFTFKPEEEPIVLELEEDEVEENLNPSLPNPAQTKGPTTEP